MPYYQSPPLGIVLSYLDNRPALHQSNEGGDSQVRARCCGDAHEVRISACCVAHVTRLTDFTLRQGFASAALRATVRVLVVSRGPKLIPGEHAPPPMSSPLTPLTPLAVLPVRFMHDGQPLFIRAIPSHCLTPTSPAFAHAPRAAGVCS